jgi:MFS family permease
MLLARLGGQMWALGLILFVLERFHSPTLAGIVGLVGMLPGLVLSPLAGALLDRYGRVRLVIVDYIVGALTGLSLALLATADVLPPWLLVLVVGLSSLTLPLALSGSRSLLPLKLPREMWDRGNAIDASTWRAAGVLGPALAGLLVGAIGPVAAVAGIGATWMAAGLLLTGVSEPPTTNSGQHVVRDAADGLRYVLNHPVLRNLTLVLPLANVAAGILAVAIPVMVLVRLHGTAFEVGLLWSTSGVAGIVSNVVSGAWLRTEGREVRVMVATYGLAALGLIAVAMAPSLLVAAAGMGLYGLLLGPADIAMFGLRQRATDPRWFGRAMSISMSLNAAGIPLGNGLAGPLAEFSTGLALGVAAAAQAFSAALTGVLLGRGPRPQSVTTTSALVLKDSAGDSNG